VSAEGWARDSGDAASGARIAADVARIWRDASPDTQVTSIGAHSGEPRLSDSLEGRTMPVGGVTARHTPHGLVLAPQASASRWEPLALSTGLLGIAATASAGTAPTVIVPVGDTPPAGDARGLWNGGLDAFRAGIRALDVKILVTSERPLLGLTGMAAHVRDGRESDEALAVAAQEQEREWAAVALTADSVVRDQALVATGRLSSSAGAGAAGGLAYCLAAAGGHLVPAVQAVPQLTGLEEAAREADVLVAVTPELSVRTVMSGTAAQAARVAAARGIPAVALASEVYVGGRDLMAAGFDAAYPCGSSREDLAQEVRRVAHTWTPHRRHKGRE